MLIKGREFLTCRLFRKIGSTVYVAAKSFEIDDIPKVKNKVRYVSHAYIKFVNFIFYFEIFYYSFRKKNARKTFKCYHKLK